MGPFIKNVIFEEGDLWVLSDLGFYMWDLSKNVLRSGCVGVLDEWIWELIKSQFSVLERERLIDERERKKGGWKRRRRRREGDVVTVRKREMLLQDSPLYKLSKVVMVYQFTLSQNLF